MLVKSQSQQIFKNRKNKRSTYKTKSRSKYKKFKKP